MFRIRRERKYKKKSNLSNLNGIFKQKLIKIIILRKRNNGELENTTIMRAKHLFALLSQNQFSTTTVTSKHF
jgi:hypothetical protein